jgi:hypothetical protein
MITRSVRFVTRSGRFVPMLALAIAACATSAASPRPARSSSTVIGTEELAAATQSNLLDVIQALRPHWLRPQTTTMTSGGEIVVYIESQRLGGPEALRQFHPSAAAQVRYFSPSEAQLRFGLGNLSGAIQIMPRTGRDP